jgi:beta-aspartyl-dipeptidase (metallo-type)
MLLLKGGEVYAPAALGIKDVLIGGGKILAIEDQIGPGAFPDDPEVVDVRGTVLVPGFVDGHQHFTGGGGEGGFHTRTPEMTLSMNTLNGVTTAVGLLGSDSHTRSLESLFAKTQSLNFEGMTAFMLTGSYRYPSPSITGSIDRDIVFIGPVIGAKLALADFRGSHFDVDDFAAMVADIGAAARISGKPGVLTLHLGENEQCLDLVFEAMKLTGFSPRKLLPTHINRRGEKILEQALEIARRGSTIDATCLNFRPTEESHPRSAAEIAVIANDNGLLGQVSFSSDAGGSVPIWNEDRTEILRMGVGSADSMLFELSSLVNEKGMRMEDALKPFTTNPAALYGLRGVKGEISVEADADLVALNPDALKIQDVIAKGRLMVRGSEAVVGGYFESGALHGQP